MPSGSGVRLMSRMVATAIAGGDGGSAAGFRRPARKARAAAPRGSCESRRRRSVGGRRNRRRGSCIRRAIAVEAGELLACPSAQRARRVPFAQQRQQPDRGPAVRSLLETIEREQRDVRALPQGIVAVSALRVAAHDGFVERDHPPQLGKARAARRVAQFALTAERAPIDRFRGFGGRRRRRAGHQRRQDGGQHDPLDVRDSAHVNLAVSASARRLPRSNPSSRAPRALCRPRRRIRGPRLPSCPPAAPRG